MQLNFYYLLMLYPLMYFVDQVIGKVSKLNRKQVNSVLAFTFLTTFYVLYEDFIFSSIDRSYFAVCSVAFSLYFLNSGGSLRSLFKAFTLLWFSLFNIWNFTGVTDIILLLGVFCFFDTDKKSQHSLFYNISWIVIAVIYFFVKEFQGQELGNLFFEALLVLTTTLLSPKEKSSPYLSILQYIFCLSVLQRLMNLNIELGPYFFLLFLILQLIFSFNKIDYRYQSIQLMPICLASAIIFLPVFGMDSFYQLFLIVYLLIYSYRSEHSLLIAKLLSIVHVFYLFLIGHVVYLHMSYLTNLQLLSAVLLIITLAYRQNLFGKVQKAP